MPCSQCPRPPVTRVATSGRHLCREHFLHLFTRRAKAELAAQGGLPDGTVAVALSGGKDSVSLLHFLHAVAKDRPRTRLVAVTVDEGIAGYRPSALEVCRQVTANLGIEWRLVATKDLAGYDIDAYAAGTAGPAGAPLPHAPRPACAPCGVFRRVGINRLAREAGADVVATGHNLDDTAQTVLMNVLQGDADRLARLAPHEEPVPGLVPRRIPLRTTPEKDVLLYALLNGLPTHDEECPYAARSRRFRTRDLLWRLEQETPGTRNAIVAFQDRVKPLLAAAATGDVATCTGCGEATSGATCKACAWKA